MVRVILSKQDNIKDQIELKIDVYDTALSHKWQKLLQQAIKQFATTLYDNRHDYVEGKSGDMVPSETRVILNTYKNMFV